MLSMASSDPQQGSQSHERFSRLVERVDGIVPWASDPTSGRFTYVGPQALDLLGYPIQDWYLDGFWPDRIHPDDRDQALAFRSAAAVRAEDHLEYRVFAADRRVVWLRDVVKVSPGGDESGQLLGLLVDVTESKRAAEDLRLARERLEQRVEERTTDLRRANERLQEQIAERLRVEAALRESEERNRFLVENAPDFILMLDLDGNILFMNRATAGYTREQFIGRSAYDLTLPEDRPVVREAFERVVRTGEVVSYEVRAVLPNQEIAWYSCRVGAIRQEGRVVALIMVSTDIGERLRTEAALRDSEQRYRALAEASAVGIWHVDLQGTTIYVNPALCALIELDSPDDLTGITYERFFTAESLKRMAVQHRLRAEGVASSYEVQLVSRTGRRRDVMISGAPLFDAGGAVKSMIGTFTDITERKQMEEALRESEDRFRTLVQELSVGVLVYDADAQVVLCNPVALELLGVSESQVLGQSGFDADWSVVREDGQPLLAPEHPVSQAIAGRRPVRNVVMGVYRAAFRDRKWLLASAEPRLGPDGGVRQVICTFSDVTERKRVEEERRQLEAQVQHTQKLESLGVLAGGIAHDFNNLLMGILGNVGLALLETPPETAAHQYLEKIESVTMHAAELTNQMLAYSGKGRFVVQPLDLSRLVKEMGHLLEMVVSKKVQLRLDLAANSPSIDADAAQMRQVVLNLVTNASEAIGAQGGMVTVRTGTVQTPTVDPGRAYFEAGLTEGPFVYVEVSDTGCGMDSETQGRIFDPFFTTKFTGRGLGLAAVLGIIRGHHGGIGLSSQPGRGTTFTALFPRSRIQAAKTEPRAGLKQAASSKGGTILVVDDEEVIRTVARATLERFGFQVLVACDGVEAVSVFREQPERIDAVLLDMTMPRMGGEETLRALRQIRPSVRIVLSSGYSVQEAAARFAGTGLAAFIQKPYPPLNLIETFRRVLGD